MTYTRHGYHIEGTTENPTESQNKPDVFCGGPGRCLQCTTEANKAVSSLLEVTDDIVYKVVSVLKETGGLSTEAAASVINDLYNREIIFRNRSEFPDPARVPVVVYTKMGDRIVVGEAAVTEDGEGVAVVSNMFEGAGVAEKLKQGYLTGAFSFHLPTGDEQLVVRRPTAQPAPLTIKFDPGKFGIPKIDNGSQDLIGIIEEEPRMPMFGFSHPDYQIVSRIKDGLIGTNIQIEPWIDSQDIEVSTDPATGIVQYNHRLPFNNMPGQYPWSMSPNVVAVPEFPGHLDLPLDPYYGIDPQKLDTMSTREYMKHRNEYLKAYDEAINAFGLSGKPITTHRTGFTEAELAAMPEKELAERQAYLMKDKEVRDSLPEFPIHPVPDAKKNQVVPPTVVATEEDEIEPGPEETMF